MTKITDRGRNQLNRNNIRFHPSSQQQHRNNIVSRIGQNQHQNNPRAAAPWNNNFNASTPFFMLNQQNNFQPTNDFQQNQVNFQSIQDDFHQASNELFQQIPKTVFTIHCGEIRPRDEGTRVRISGKVGKRPRSGRFLEIKDLKGCTQLVATDDKPEISHRFQSIPADAYITVIGKVQLRPSNFINNVSLKLYVSEDFNS